MARYLVTGGAGFIGSSLVAGLLARGDSATILDNFSSGRESNLASLKGDFDVVRGDICVASDVAKALKDCVGVLHHAAIPSVTKSVEDPLFTNHVNVTGTLIVLQCARAAGVKKLTFAASSAAYGDDPTLPKTESMLVAPISPYGAQKIAGENYVRVYAKTFGMHAVSLRYFNVFGSRQDPKSEYAAAIPRFVQALASGKTPTIFGDGEQTRDFCHVSDVVAANFAALDHAETASGRVFNIARGEATTVNALIDAIANVLGVSAVRHHGPIRAGDILHSRADISAAREFLKFEPKMGIEEGLRETVRAFLPAT